LKLLIYNPKDRTGGPWGSFILQRNLTTQTANRKVPIISEEIIVELRKQIKNSMKELKEYHGVVSIKAEFEAEGSRKDELIMLRELVENAGLAEKLVKTMECYEAGAEKAVEIAGEVREKYSIEKSCKELAEVFKDTALQ